MPEKINIEMSTSEAKHFRDNFGSNPELLLAQELGADGDSYNLKIIAGVGITCFFISVFSLGYLLTEERTKTEEIAHLLEVGKKKIDDAAKIVADDVFLKFKESVRAERLALIIARNSDINQQSAVDGRTLLHRTVSHHTPSFDNIDFLIRAGADLNIRAYGWTEQIRDKNKLGMTPVMSALFHSEKKPQLNAVVLHLVTHHADKIDFSIENGGGNTLLAMAMQRLKQQPDNTILQTIVRRVRQARIKKNT